MRLIVAIRAAGPHLIFRHQPWRPIEAPGAAGQLSWYHKPEHGFAARRVIPAAATDVRGEPPEEAETPP
jgi:hypothetical protein